MWINPLWLGSLLVSRQQQQPMLVCPSTHVQPVQPFDLTRFVNRTWYSQEQQPVIYQGVKDFYCVTDTYTQRASNQVHILTSWHSGSSTGASKSTQLHARIPDTNIGSGWRVGYQWMPDWMRGPYWVVAVGPVTSSGGYAWMIVSGGAPSHISPSGQGCKTGDWINGSGLWLFSSEPFPPKQQVEEMRGILKQMGYDLSVLLPVEHRGCAYDIQRTHGLVIE